MTFSAAAIHYLWLILIGILLLIAAVQLINSFRYGARMPLNIIVSLVFIGGVAAVISVTMSLLSTVDWSSTYILTLPSFSFPHFGL